MDRLYPQEVDARSLSPLTLAFVGDGVYGLMVREMLACQANRPNGTLHRLSVSMVRAEAQSSAMDVLLPLLTEEEEAVFRRGRNAHTARAGGDYHRATGLEALFGYLYLSGSIDRCRELFAAIHPPFSAEEEGKTDGTTESDRNI